MIAARRFVQIPAGRSSDSFRLGNLRERSKASRAGAKVAVNTTVVTSRRGGNSWIRFPMTFVCERDSGGTCSLIF